MRLLIGKEIDVCMPALPVRKEDGTARILRFFRCKSFRKRNFQSRVHAVFLQDGFQVTDGIDPAFSISDTTVLFRRKAGDVFIQTRFAFSESWRFFRKIHTDDGSVPYKREQLLQHAGTHAFPGPDDQQPVFRAAGGGQYAFPGLQEGKDAGTAAEIIVISFRNGRMEILAPGGSGRRVLSHIIEDFMGTDALPQHVLAPGQIREPGTGMLPPGVPPVEMGAV